MSCDANNIQFLNHINPSTGLLNNNNEKSSTKFYSNNNNGVPTTTANFLFNHGTFEPSISNGSLQHMDATSGPSSVTSNGHGAGPNDSGFLTNNNNIYHLKQTAATNYFNSTTNHNLKDTNDSEDYEEDTTFYDDVSLGHISSLSKITKNKTTNNNVPKMNGYDSPYVNSQQYLQQYPPLSSQYTNSSPILTTSTTPTTPTNNATNTSIIGGRTLTPAYNIKPVQINKTSALPGSTKRPPHLRSNND
jgi:hypothetical protein